MRKRWARRGSERDRESGASGGEREREEREWREREG